MLVAFASIAGITSCKDEVLKLADADHVYITITPERPMLVVARDTITMTALVRGVDGRDVSDAKIIWTTEDPTVAKIVDGNRLVAVRGGEERTTKVRATLQNGKYAFVTASVARSNGADLSLMLSTSVFAGETIYLVPEEATHILAVVAPQALLKAYEIAFEIGNPDLIAVEPRQLDPVFDAELIKATPAGGQWYTIKPKAGQSGRTTLTLGVGDRSRTYQINVGARLIDDTNQYFGLALRPEMTESEQSDRMDINTEATVSVYAKIAPATPEAYAEIKEQMEWAIDGNGGVLVDVTSEQSEDVCIFRARVRSGATTGEFSLTAKLQGRSVRKSYSVQDYASKPFDGLTFSVSSLELLSGEQKPFRVKVEPRSSQSIILSDIDALVSFSAPGIAEFLNDKGTYQVRGLQEGSTELILTVRGRAFRLPITVSAAPESVTIDNLTPTAVMVGDEVSWSAVVRMRGADVPDYNLLKWSVSATDKAQLSGGATGQSVRLRGVAPGEHIVVTADYRGKSTTRELAVVPAKSNTEITPAMLEMDASGVEANTLILQPKGGADVPTEISVLPLSGAPVNLTAGTYNATAYRIVVKWGVITKVVTAGSLTLTSTPGGTMTAVLDLSLGLASGTVIKVTGTLPGLIVA